MLFGYKIIKQSKRVRPLTADLYSGKREIDEQEANFLAIEAEKEAMRENKGSKLYRLVSWLF